MRTPVLNINQFQKSKYLNDVYINSFSNHIQLNKNLISKPHSHNFYLCVLFTEGSGTHEIDFNSYEICSGKAFVLKPGQTHFWNFEEEPEGFIFFHSKEFYELQFLEHKLNLFPFFYSYLNSPVLDVSQKKLKKLTAIFQEAQNEYVQNNLLRELKLTNLINNIYIELTRSYTENINLEKFNSPFYIEILESLEGLISKHFYTEKLPKFYANKLNITTKHLNRIVKKTTNKTTSELIYERIILEAKRLIVHSHENLSSVAEILEFSDYAYFSKVFKSKTGLAPLDFRKKYLR